MSSDPMGEVLMRCTDKPLAEVAAILHAIASVPREHRMEALAIACRVALDRNLLHGCQVPHECPECGTSWSASSERLDRLASDHG